METLEQQILTKIYSKVENFAKHNPGDDNVERKLYGGLAYRLPILIRSAGLAQALAFADARAESQPSIKQLLEDLSQIVVEDHKTIFLDKSRNSNNLEYIRLTRKSILALSWFKRFAQSILKVEPTEASIGG
ncbi:MAG: type III-B CRISPR module-associated protein Cmr5 [Chloroflexi bacterium]|nr:type III-B CRISPR module-associated protein Cmr5 [Chloroflexota bacterium]